MKPNRIKLMNISFVKNTKLKLNAEERFNTIKSVLLIIANKSFITYCFTDKGRR